MVYMTYECNTLMIKNEAACVIQHANARYSLHKTRCRENYAMIRALRIWKSQKVSESTVDSKSFGLIVQNVGNIATLAETTKVQTNQSQIFSKWKDMDEKEKLRTHIRNLREEIRNKDAWIFWAKQKLRLDT